MSSQPSKEELTELSRAGQLSHLVQQLSKQRGRGIKNPTVRGRFDQDVIDEVAQIFDSKVEVGVQRGQPYVWFGFPD